MNIKHNYHCQTVKDFSCTLYGCLFCLFHNKENAAFFFFFSSRRRHTRCSRDWSSDVCSSDLVAYERDLHDFAELLLLEKLGPRTLQSLALVAEVVHGAPSRFDDPARFSFAHGDRKSVV